MKLAAAQRGRRHPQSIVPTLDGSVVSFPLSSTHDAFPGVCRLGTGAQHLLLVFREATSHTSIDGILRKRTSTDDGDNWSGRTTIYTPAGGEDVRGVSLLRLANDDIVLTSTRTDGTTYWIPIALISTDDGATWSSAIDIVTSFTGWAFCESPPVVATNGDLRVPYYGIDTGDTYQSIRLSASSDGGATWTHFSDIADGATYGRDLQEPCLARLADGRWLCMVRSDMPSHLGDEILYTTSVDEGLTWEPLRPAFGGTGRPSVMQRPSDGLILCMFRHFDVTLDWWRMKSSNDVLYWSDGYGDFTGGNTDKGVYGQWVELSSGQMACVFAIEPSSTNADLYFAKIIGGS